MDEILKQEPRLTFVLLIDLHAYAPIQNRRFFQDWTGDPHKDRVGNCIKRFFDKGCCCGVRASVSLAPPYSFPTWHAARTSFA